MATPKQTLKLFINKNTGSVLFAEAQKEFVDFLLTLPTLSLGAIMELFKLDLIGSLGKIHESLDILESSSLFQSGVNRNIILKICQSSCRPNFSFLPSPPPSTDSSEHSAYKYNRVTDYNIRSCGYVRASETYIVMDDLRILPPIKSFSAALSLYRELHVSASHLEEKVIDFGLEEASKLIQVSFKSRNVLTDFFASAELKRNVRASNESSSFLFSPQPRSESECKERQLNAHLVSMLRGRYHSQRK